MLIVTKNPIIFILIIIVYIDIGNYNKLHRQTDEHNKDMKVLYL